VEDQKTHRLVAKPTINVRFLADYMAASDQARRTIIRGCKYRTIARLVQHDEAKLAVSKYMLDGTGDPNGLKAAADFIRTKLADDQFDADCNAINADYVERFADVVENVSLPKGSEWKASQPFKAQPVNGVRITFEPNLLLERVDVKNRVRRGAMMLRYKKGARLPDEVAAFQSSAILGLLRMYGEDYENEIERGLCLTLDAHTGEAHPAPTNAVSRFNNTKAACATIADMWDNIKAPPDAVL
jgi:hypothetical protein